MTRTVSRAPALHVEQESGQALAVLRTQGFQTPPRPDGDLPPLPRTRLTDMNDEELMEVFAELTAWTSYLAVQVACAQIDERMFERDLDLMEAQELIRNWGGGSGERVTVAKAQRQVAERVVLQNERRDEAHAYRKLVEVLASNVERDAALISRELTRRTSAAPLNRRAERWRP